jgi:hypothetical protein
LKVTCNNPLVVMGKADDVVMVKVSVDESWGELPAAAAWLSAIRTAATSTHETTKERTCK